MGEKRIQICRKKRHSNLPNTCHVRGREMEEGGGEVEWVRKNTDLSEEET